jgi:hypothetical protein
MKDYIILRKAGKVAEKFDSFPQHCTTRAMKISIFLTMPAGAQKVQANMMRALDMRAGVL